MIKGETWDPETGLITTRYMTIEEHTAEFGPAFAEFLAHEQGDTPLTPFQERTQAEQDTHEALSRAGIRSIEDLAVEGDDRSIPIEGVESHEYDDAGADADCRARQARAAENRRTR